MSYKNKVAWTEGMFLRPQHFQQHERYVENLVTEGISSQSPYFWGFSDLAFDQDLLKLGKLSLSKAQGLFPDGTAFSIPSIDPTPNNYDVDLQTERDIKLYLCLPLEREGATQLSSEEAKDTRLFSASLGIRDVSSSEGLSEDIDVSLLNLQLRSDLDDLSGYTVLPIAVISVQNQTLTLNPSDDFIPPLISTKASTYLYDKLEELLSLIQYRAEALSGRLNSSERGSSSAINDFMNLQLLNRIEPSIQHIVDANSHHALHIYLTLSQFAGELATFAEVKLRPPKLPEYNHDALGETFGRLFSLLRRYLSVVHEQTAITLPLAERKYGIHVSPIEDRKLLDSSILVLAIRGQFNTRESRSHIAQFIRVAPVEKIRDIISAQTAGIKLWPLESGPREIPFTSNTIYFEIEQQDELWKSLQKSAAIAVHIAYEIPELELELWAIRTE